VKSYPVLLRLKSPETKRLRHSHPLFRHVIVIFSNFSVVLLEVDLVVVFLTFLDDPRR
jgi:hypothetical protein